jgi:hypothetical protein
MDTLLRISHYLPIGTTVISAIFAYLILSRYRAKPQAYHLLWWGLGVVAYGFGTLVESCVTLFGWHVALFKLWYVAGALLGGEPLALGTVYLLMGRKAGHIGTTLLLTTVAITSAFVILSPIKVNIDTSILSSSVLEWQSIRLVSPFINGLAFVFLVGGAIYSTIKFIGIPESRHVAFGNIFIAIGGILPGIGGMYSRMGHTEALYIAELVGIVFIWFGYRLCQSRPVRKPAAQEITVAA